MKQLLSILAVWLTLVQSFSATYYIDSAAGTGGDGSIGNPFDSYADVTSIYNAGDFVWAKGGFTGQIALSRNATAGNPASFGTYGNLTNNGGFNITGDNIRFLAPPGTTWLITQTNVPAATYAGIIVSGSDNFELWGLQGRITIEYIQVEPCINIINSVSPTITGGTYRYTAWAEYPFPVGTGEFTIWFGTASTNATIRYTTQSIAADYFGASSGNWSWMNFYNNYLGPMNTNSGSHMDNWQPNTAWTNMRFENNWDTLNQAGIFDEDGSHHFYYFEVEGANRCVVRGNVMVNSQGYANHSGIDNVAFYHNTFHTNAWYDTGNDQAISFNTQGGTTSFNRAVNNIFSYATDASDTPDNISAPSTASFSHNLSFGQAAMANGSNNQTGNPEFVSGLSEPWDLRLGATSAARNTGGAITTVNGNGTSATVTVNGFATAFWPGDTITVGADTATVSSITDTNTIVLGSSITFANGESVLWEGRTDMGAYPYNITLLSGGTYTVNGSTVTCTPNGSASATRGVVFWTNGVPTLDLTAPYTFDKGGATLDGVEILAYYAQAQSTFSATLTITATGVIATGAPIATGGAILR